jgi:DNA (cytosine-5)-methyltransferase 1
VTRPGDGTQSSPDKKVSVDLFCGAGGASLGIERAGFSVEAAVDVDRAAIATHRENFDGQTVKHDLRDVDPSVLPPQARSPAHTHGSPVCKDSSAANHDASADGERNELAFRYLEWIDELEPAVFTMEQVPRFWGYRGDEFRERANELGYRLDTNVLNAADYGVPQDRERLFVIGVDDRTDIDIRWPKRLHAPEPYQTLTGRVVTPWFGVADVLDVEDVIHKGSGATSPANWRPGSEPSHTVTGQGNNVIAPADDPDDWRKYTTDELATLQSFPDDFEFTGNTTETESQIGNAVPPRLMEAVAGVAREMVAESEFNADSGQEVIA